MERLNRYRLWFMAAAIYNALWGSLVVVWPDAMFKLIGVSPIGSKPIFQSVGMMVAVYALGYWMIARDPARFGRLFILGFWGSCLGLSGSFSRRFVAICLGRLDGSILRMTSFGFQRLSVSR